MAAYYNEIDEFAAAWLRELIREGLIADGEVDTRSIVDVRPDDVRGFTQCHFFAGIGGWSYALRLAGWDDDRAVWTGSCPCQPWSSAGAGLEADDSRDLWPTWFKLIRECKPGVVFGEQVAGKAGGAWVDRVYVDMEGIRYAVWAVDLPAACVGTFHLRQRLWFVADADDVRWGWRTTTAGRQARSDVAGGGLRLGHAFDQERRGFAWHTWIEGACRLDVDRSTPWVNCRPIKCRDGKTRFIEPSIEPLAHGIPAQVGRLRGYGNAIVPQVAAEFVMAYMEATAAEREAGA